MRKVECMDVFEWAVYNQHAGPVVTSPPDMHEQGWDYLVWHNWYEQALHHCLDVAGDVYPCLFYVTDRRFAGELVSKDHMVLGAAHQRGLRVLWHKIALRRDVGRIDLHRPTYSHLIAIGGKGCRPGPQSPDVFHRGPVLYANGMGVAAARFAVQFVAKYGFVYNPFCGHGTVLAAADEIGIDSLGVDISPRQCEYAMKAILPM